METEWSTCKNILCVRPDNMGDVLMSSPAIKALKEKFQCKITLLTSSMGKKIAPYIPCIDETIVYDAPWVKGTGDDGPESFWQMVKFIESKKFDGAVIFTVFSQNPLPSVMLTYFAGISKRLAYCRENPYKLLTHWMPDIEPYESINHQVERDLKLVDSIGASLKNPSLELRIPDRAYSEMYEKLRSVNFDPAAPWIIIHPGASEMKRQYPIERFRELIKKIVLETNVQILITGTPQEEKLVEALADQIGPNVHPIAGLLGLEQFIALVDVASLVVSVNTATVHIAAALKTTVIVLYALTNPQHTPWNVAHRVFSFPVAEELKSSNGVLQFVQKHLMEKSQAMPNPCEVVECVRHHLQTGHLQPL